MSEERELLKRALDAWDDEGTFDYLGVMDCLMEEIRTYLKDEKEAEHELCKVLEDACAHIDSYGGMSISYRQALARARGEKNG